MSLFYNSKCNINGLIIIIIIIIKGHYTTVGQQGPL